MSDHEHEFRIRPGKVGASRTPRTRSFLNQVLRAAQKSGHVPKAGAPRRKGSGGGGTSFGRGRARYRGAHLFRPNRRVVVKARIVRHQGRAYRAAPLSAHLSYLKREGVSRDGARGVMFDAAQDRADDRAFAASCGEDCHHFRFIISPEDAGEMQDLRSFTRDLVRQMEHDLGTKLEWVATDHWSTDNPHVHLLVRGVDQTGADLVIARDYISRGLRSRAEDLVGIELGPRQQHQIEAGLQAEIPAERWTRIDREIARASDDLGGIDLRPEPDRIADPSLRRLMIGRLQHLQKMGLAEATGPAEWRVAPEAERVLRDLGERGDIIKTMHRAFTGRGTGRAVSDYVIDSGGPGGPVIGRLADKGLHDEMSGEAYAVIDATDGRAHHIRLRGIGALEHSPPIGGIVELRRIGGPDDPSPTMFLAPRSDLALSDQIQAEGATWLDHRLVERQRMPLSHGGFGAEVRSALEARTDYLVEQGLAQRQGARVLLQRNLLRSLRQRELHSVSARLAAETGQAALPRAGAGEQVNGLYRRRLNLASGRYAMIEGTGPDGGLGFRLVPWSREIEKRLGQTVSGTIRESGGIEWSLGRKRGLGL